MPKIDLDLLDLFGVEGLEPPIEGWHKPCEFKDHNWVLDIEDGQANIICTDPCDLNVYNPGGVLPVCGGYWENEDFNTPEPIPVDLTFVNDSSPAGPWGPAEYGYWIDVRPKRPEEFFPPDEVVVQEIKDAHDRIVARNEKQS